MRRITAKRYHDISTGHRVAGHESKCASLHGHNYRFHFYCDAPELDSLGRVIDFGDIKMILCAWIEDHWDHKFLIWEEDPMRTSLEGLEGVIIVPFNPTAENMAQYLVEVIAPRLLEDVRLYKCEIEETRKCSAIYEI